MNSEQFHDALYRERCLRETIEAENRRLRKAVEAVECLIGQSEGVAGLHLNGCIAAWESLRTGGRFETWLVDFDAALEKRNGRVV